MAASVAVPLLVYCREMWVASQGRGGTFALVIACILAASIALLLWTATFGAPPTIYAARLSRGHLLASAMAGIGYAGLQAAILGNADSNLLGGWALMLGPLLWLGVLAATILLLPCVVTRIARV